MTDFRVTPQAVEAAATDGYRVVLNELNDVERAYVTGVAQRMLTAAVPLLRQPLQDENERLRAIVDALVSALERTEANFVLSVRGRPVRDMCENLAENRAAMTAAVPVGTGNPTQPRADD